MDLWALETDMTDSSHNSEGNGMFEEDSQILQKVLTGQPAPEIVTLEGKIRAAQLANDVAALDSLNSENLLFAGHDGQLGSKCRI